MTRSHIASLSLLAGLALAPAAHASFSYAFIFGDPAADTTKVGSAIHHEGEIKLTTDENQTGAFWYNTPQHVESGFTTTFEFRVGAGPTTGVTGDGFAFVIQNDPAGAAAQGGGGSALGYGMGFDGSGNYHSIFSAIAIEFDTFSFGPPGEFLEGHVAIHLAPSGGEIHSADSYSIAHVQLSDFAIDLSSGGTYEATIQYIQPDGPNPGHLDVYISTQLILSVPMDLTDPNADSNPSDGILSIAGDAYVGFTAATGLADSVHAISSWGFDDNLVDGCAPPHWHLWSWGGTGAFGPGNFFNSSAQVIATRPLTFRWFKNNVEITDDDGGRILGLGTNQLVITDFDFADQDYYRMDAENPCGTMTGLEVFLGVCVADIDDGASSGTPDGGVDINDLLFFLAMFELGDLNADLDDGNAFGSRDGAVDINDLIFFLTRFELGC